MPQQPNDGNTLSWTGRMPRRHVLYRFEAAWQRGERPDPGAYLPPPGDAGRLALLIDLVNVDLERRLSAGEAARVEEYLRRFPELGADPDVVLDLIGAEYELRCQREGGPVPFSDYARRFRQHREALRGRLPALPGRDTLEVNGLDLSKTVLTSAPPAGGSDNPSWPDIPGYEVQERLGGGGMGVVWKAWQVFPPRPVALKMIRDVVAGGEEHALFRREAEAAAALQHPHIIQVFAFGEHQRQPYFAMELAEGGSLRDRLADGPLLPREAARLVETLARTMEFAHQKGIVHRDLKPENVLLQIADCRLQIDKDKSAICNLQSAIPKIADFGLAKKLDGAASLIPSNRPVGTPPYMAPEQAAGQNRLVGPATDVYALGAILYEALTGRPPFQAATTEETLLQVITREPAPPRQLNPAIGHDLETIALKCLQKEPAKRYGSAEALADDLARFLDGRHILARPVTLWEKGVKWARRRPAQAALTAVSVLALAAAGVLAVGSVFFAKLGAAYDEAKKQEVLATSAKEDADRQRRRADHYLYVANMNLAQHAWQEADVGWMARLLDGHARPGPDDARGFEWYYLHRLLHGTARTLPGHADQVTAVALSPDGTRLAAVAGDFNPAASEVKVWDLGTGRETVALKGRGEVFTGVAFGPDGGRLITTSEGTDPSGRLLPGEVKVWDAATGKEAAFFQGPRGGFTGMALSPDGGRLATFAGTLVQVWDLDGRHELLALPRQPSPVVGVAWDAGGKRLATGGEDRAVRLWDAATGAALREFRAGGGVLGVAFSPDGQRLAAAGRDRAVTVWDVQTGEAHTLAGHTQEVKAVAFSPDGKRLATASYDRTVRVWEAGPGKEALVLKGHADYVLCLAWAPDGKALVTGGKDRAVKVWDATAAQESRVLDGHANPVWAVAADPTGRRLAAASATEVKVWDLAGGQGPLTLKGSTAVAFSPDGAHLAAGADDGAVKLWDAATGQELLTLKGHDAKVLCVAFRGDGQRLAAGSDDGTLRVWDAASGRELFAVEEHAEQVNGVAFSPDGSLLATAGQDRMVKLWDADGRLLRTLDAHAGPVTSVAFTPDGRRLASGSWDKTVRLWDPHTGAEVLALRGHTSSVTGVAFSPDGRRLASSSWDETVKVWDAETGQQLLSLRGHAGWVSGVAFSGDGRRLASAGEDQTVRLWLGADAALDR